MSAANDNISPTNVYTLDEAAAHLRLTNRGVAKLARRHGLCLVRGRDILLTGKDIESVKDVLRCHSNSTGAVKRGGSVDPTSNKHYAELQELMTGKPQKRSSQRR